MRLRRCRRCRRARLPRPKPISPRARIASASWRACARWSIGSSPGPPTCCVRRHRCRARLALRIAEETGKQAGAAAGAAVVRAGMGTGRAGDRMQAARDRCGTAPGQHAGTPRARRELPGAYPCGRGRAASPRRRAVDRRPQARPGRLQLRCAWSTPTSASGARPAAPASSSPAPRIPFAEAPRARGPKVLWGHKIAGAAGRLRHFFVPAAIGTNPRARGCRFGGMRPEFRPEPLRAERGDVRLRPAGPACE